MRKLKRGEKTLTNMFKANAKMCRTCVNMKMLKLENVIGKSVATFSQIRKTLKHVSEMQNNL